MTFDPAEVSYDDLLQHFWNLHDATEVIRQRAYRTAVLALDDTQLAAARTSRERLGAMLGERIATPVERIQEFWPAEAYHQKFYLRRHRELWREAQTQFPDEGELLSSTLAARLNGLVGRSYDNDQLADKLRELGLGPLAVARFVAAAD